MRWGVVLTLDVPASYDGAWQMVAQDEELERARSRLGAVLRGKYTLDRVLGVGGMAAVYAASHRNGRDVAIKMLHPELSLRADIRVRFLREGQAANAVKHPGVVAVLDDDVTDDGAAFLVMELLEGETLEELSLRSGRCLPVETVLAIGVQLCDVLAASHAKGVIHRDIKPANLFLTSEGVLKVLDFGIARLRDAATTSATATGAMLGTPAFMAPEQAAGRAKAVDALTDVYSAGATLFALASGRLVHEGETSQAIVIQTAVSPARSLASVLPEAPLPLVAALDRALAFDREERWPGAAEMRDALHGAGVAIFGRAPLLGSFPRADGAHATRFDASRARNAHPEDGRPPGATDLAVSDTVAATEAPRAPRGPSAHPMPSAGSMTTTGPVSRGPSPALPASRKAPAKTLLVGAALGGALLVAAVFAIVGDRGSPASAARVAPSQLDVHPPPSVSAPAVSLRSSPSADAVGDPAPSIAVTDLPRSAPAAAAAGGSMTRGPRRHDAPTKGDAATSAAPSDASSAAGNAKCDPPFVIDASGKKIWTEGCL